MFLFLLWLLCIAALTHERPGLTRRVARRTHASVGRFTPRYRTVKAGVWVATTEGQMNRRSR